MFLERGFEVDHSPINRWVLAHAPLIEKRLRRFRKPHCGSVRIDETYVKIRGKWRYLHRAIDKRGHPVDFLLVAKRDLNAAKRFFVVGFEAMLWLKKGFDFAGQWSVREQNDLRGTVLGIEKVNEI